MTREEEIRQASKLFAADVENDGDRLLLEVGFSRGIEWADEHPKQKEEHQRGLCGNMIN